MGLKEQQDLIAHLYTDAEIYSRFYAEPESVGARFGLTRSEIRDLAAMAGDEVIWFADSLFWKRLREVEKLLPASRRAFGVKFEQLFREFSRRFNPVSMKKHLEDALTFAGWLTDGDRLDPVAADVLKFESARLRHNAESRSVTLCPLNYDVRPAFGIVGVDSEIRRRRSLAVWLRIGRWTRFYFI